MRLVRRALTPAAIAMVPALLIQAQDEWAYRTALEQELSRRASREAIGAAADVRQLFETVRQLLVTLS
jgi:hypothetical protein